MSSDRIKRLCITDTTLRDAHQSLIATRMRTEDMIPLTRSIDKAGFFSVEAWGGATFDSCIRFLNEDPWERLRKLKAELNHTPIQMLLRGQNLVGYRHYSDDVVDRFVDLSHKNGVDIFRVFDALNDIRNMERPMTRVKETGAHLQGTISYTTSPVHSVKGFVDLARELYARDCDSICIKDMAGLIMPGIAKELITGIKDEMDVLVDLHSHCTSGIAPMSYDAAIDAGVDILDTAMSPFALGTSQPPTESIVASVQGTSRDTGIDLLQLRQIRNECLKIRNKYEGLFTPVAERVDSDVLIYQLPGGMITNLVSQLQDQDALDKMEAVFDEIPRVREDLGYPPLVTPTSQIVGTQAVFNVLTGGRYKTISNEVKDYVKGLYGKSPGPISDEIRTLIIGNEEVIAVRPADLLAPMYEKMKAEATEAGLIRQEEDVLTYILYPAIAPSFLKGERKPEPIPSAVQKKDSNLSLPSSMQVEVDGETFTVRILAIGDQLVEGKQKASEPPKSDIPGGVKSNMQGMVLQIRVGRGDQVTAGETLIVLEAMKMENPITSPRDGVVKEIFVDAGDTVLAGDVLLVVE
ncbi:pyruvate/oxaloacetate carboxyltransferase [Methanospirillum sp. J.3.6.1-F.2.7.3]|jgi:pyruvate carboxylase subunit B|uniref:Pyruvate/oxaloacetate carboxyltransferase n=2 Tax=Methanospirillum TaxID=2202 RepID=A0A8E7B292_9EURY|nr:MULTISPECIES: pyruvate/oxaloacetate carboxyltransferase [Methanospirillum]MDX8551732.1 pyruvate/oxaloacetate carboxyltransferase [Methanospirillum hungatei]QVV89102.1 pyruvate/oxaloacetate carboxyltransferase [Methanospirillum sp. J.3.6.1-F.2.7.3]QXO93598.1 pyruvate/oxaloacetate carboxyltransferase [Methanospirillum hungatei]